MPDGNDLTAQLETRRASLIASSREILSAAGAAQRATTAEEDTRYAAALVEIRALNTRLDDLADQAQREERARVAGPRRATRRVWPTTSAPVPARPVCRSPVSP